MQQTEKFQGNATKGSGVSSGLVKQELSVSGTAAWQNVGHRLCGHMLLAYRKNVEQAGSRTYESRGLFCPDLRV